MAALFYSLIESAKLCRVEPRACLREATLRAVRGEVRSAPGHPPSDGRMQLPPDGWSQSTRGTLLAAGAVLRRRRSASSGEASRRSSGRCEVTIQDFGSIGRIHEARAGIAAGRRVGPHPPLHPIRGYFGVSRPELETPRNVALRQAGLE